MVYHKIPAKIFVINNHGYLAIRTTQKNFFEGRLIGESSKTGILLPETEKIARAYGIEFARIGRQKDLEKIPQILNSKNAIICEIMSPEWQVTLSVTAKKLPDGKLISASPDEMSPFLPDEELKKIKNILQ